MFKESITSTDDDWSERLTTAFDKLSNYEKEVANEIISILYAHEC
jgi:hypothetical protein